MAECEPKSHRFGMMDHYILFGNRTVGPCYNGVLPDAQLARQRCSRIGQDQLIVG